jgi:hypothetical protein
MSDATFGMYYGCIEVQKFMKQSCYLFFFKSTLKVTYKPYSRYEARVCFKTELNP